MARTATTPKKAKRPPGPDPIDLVASALATRVTVDLADEIARALRRLRIHPGTFGARRDRTAAERQRRHRQKRKEH